MKRSTIIIAITLSALLFIVGYSFPGHFFQLAIPTRSNTYIISTGMTYTFRFTLVFAITLALIPICIIVVWKLGNIYTFIRRIASIVLILTVMAGACYIAGNGLTTWMRPIIH